MEQVLQGVYLILVHHEGSICQVFNSPGIGTEVVRESILVELREPTDKEDSRWENVAVQEVITRYQVLHRVLLLHLEIAHRKAHLHQGTAVVNSAVAIQVEEVDNN